MRTHTVLLPLKEQRFNPITQRMELMDTGMLQEYSAGRPIGQPIPAPQMPSRETLTALQHSGQLSGGSSHLSVSLHSQDPRPLAAHYQRPGETLEAAADRLADAADSGRVSVGAGGSMRVSFGGGGQGHGGY